MKFLKMKMTGLSANLFGDFLLGIREGKSIEAVLKEAYGRKFKNGISDLKEKWVEFIKSRY